MKYHFVLEGGAISIDLNITHEQAADILHSFVLSVPDEEEEVSEEDLDASIEEIVKEDKPTKKYKKRKERKPMSCSNCGEPGHTKPTCPKDNEPEDPVEDTGEPLSEEDYRAVLECKSDGLTSKETADQLELNRREVNVAFGTNLYESYLGVRK